MPGVGSAKLAPGFAFLNPVCISVQVKTAGSPVSIPVCDDSSVKVECLSRERLGVNITWKQQLADAPPASLPDLRDVGMFSHTAALKARGLLGSQCPRPSDGASPAPAPACGGPVTEKFMEINRVLAHS